MLDKPEIIRTTPQHTAVIRLTVPRAEIREVMGPAMAEVRAAVAAQGITPTGPMFSHHLRMHPDVFDLEVGLPVPKPIAPSGRVTPSELPARTVARTVYHGGYEGLALAWEELETWVAVQERAPAPDLWECYEAGPESSPDPTTWRTTLHRPLVD